MVEIARGVVKGGEVDSEVEEPTVGVVMTIGVVVLADVATELVEGAWVGVVIGVVDAQPVNTTTHC